MKLRSARPVAVLAALSLLATSVYAGDKKKKDPEEIGNRERENITPYLRLGYALKAGQDQRVSEKYRVIEKRLRHHQ